MFHEMVFFVSFFLHFARGGWDGMGWEGINWELSSTQQLTTVPRPAGPVANRDSTNTLAEGYHIPDDLMSGHQGKRVAKVAALGPAVAMANTACQDFDENLLRPWRLERQVFDHKRGVGLLDHGGLVGLWE